MKEKAIKATSQIIAIFMILIVFKKKISVILEKNLISLWAFALLWWLQFSY